MTEKGRQLGTRDGPGPAGKRAAGTERRAPGREPAETGITPGGSPGAGKRALESPEPRDSPSAPAGRQRGRGPRVGVRTAGPAPRPPERSRGLRTDGWTDRRADRRTDGRADRQTDRHRRTGGRTDSREEPGGAGVQVEGGARGRREGEGSGGAGRARGAGRKRGGAASGGLRKNAPTSCPARARKREPGPRARDHRARPRAPRRSPPRADTRYGPGPARPGLPPLGPRGKWGEEEEKGGVQGAAHSGGASSTRPPPRASGHSSLASVSPSVQGVREESADLLG